MQKTVNSRNHGLVLFDPPGARVDLGVMAIKGLPTFPKAPALLEPHHQII